ncbi:hypothetical protein ACWC3X_36910 [Streptomyces populi]
MHEELGITPRLGRLLAVDWAPNGAEGDKVLYLFDGGGLAQETVEGIRLQTEELKAVRFLAPREIADRTIPRLARRIPAAIEARAESAPVHLEHGQAPGKQVAKRQWDLWHRAQEGRPARIQVSTSGAQAAAFFREVARTRTVWWVRNDDGCPIAVSSSGHPAFPTSISDTNTGEQRRSVPELSAQPAAGWNELTGADGPP